MAADANKLRYLAARGHFGHSALLDPDVFVNQTAPSLGIQVAQNSMQGPPVKGMESQGNPDIGAISPELDKNRNAANDALAERLKAAGASPEDIANAQQGL